MTDLKQLLDEAVGTYRPASDEETVQHRVRRRQRTRRFAAVVVAIAIVTVPGWLAWSAFGPAPADHPATEAPPSTYVLDNFEVAPHVDPQTGEVSATEVDVTFDSRWSTEEFPGVHDCTLHVRDAAGVEIGFLAFELEVYEQATRTHDEGIGPIPVRGPIEGASADGSCSTKRLDTPIAYEISDVQIGVALSITYVVGWPDSLAEGEYPGPNACTAALWDGQALASVHRFTLSVSGGPQEATFNREPNGSPTEATVTCMPFVREGVFPDPNPPTPTTRATGPSAPTDVLTIREDDDDSFKVTYPIEWYASPTPINDQVCAPYEILALATYPLRPGGEAVTDFQLPSRAVENLGPNDILIWLNENGSACGGTRDSAGPSGFPDRPRHFGPVRVCGDFDLLCPSDGRNLVPGIRGWWIAFRDSGRSFYVFVGMGEGAYANPDRHQEAWDILDSLEFLPR